MIDLIPIAQLKAIRSAVDSAPRQQQRGLSLVDEDENDADDALGKTSKAALELSLETEPGGYNSGRIYRVGFPSSP